MTAIPDIIDNMFSCKVVQLLMFFTFAMLLTFAEKLPVVKTPLFYTVIVIVFSMFLYLQDGGQLSLAVCILAMLVLIRVFSISIRDNASNKMETNI